MWADAQRDGRPAEYKWHVCESSVILFLYHAAARVSCSNGAETKERKTWTQSEFCTWKKIRQEAKVPENVYSVPAQETAKDRAKFG